MPFDPYAILGLERAASDDAIRKAYRRLARELHPDLNDSPGATERFTELGQAYGVLMDARRRRLFDLHGAASLDPSFDPGRTDPSGQAPGAERPAPARPRARDRREPPQSRREPPQSRREPPSQEASADVTVQLPIELALAISGGTLRVDSPLGATLTVEVPRGARTGDRVRLPGRGRPGQRGARPGDLIVELQVLPHPYFHREGLDLVLELPVTVAEALEGAQIKIPTLDGWLRIRVPAGSRGGERLRLRGKGLVDGQGRVGDLRVHLSVRLPERLPGGDRLVERLENLYDAPVRDGLRL